MASFWASPGVLRLLIGLLLAWVLLILCRRRTAIVRRFRCLLRIPARVFRLLHWFAAAEGFGQKIGKRLTQVQPACQTVTQREQAAGDQCQAGHYIGRPRHRVGHRAAYIHRLGEHVGALELCAADIGRSGGSRIDFAEKKRGGKAVGQPNASVNELRHVIRRRHVPFHTINAEYGSRDGNGERHLPAQNQCAEEQK